MSDRPKEIIQPKRPLIRTNWGLIDVIYLDGITPTERWLHERGYVALSDVVHAPDPGQEDVGPEWHVSFSLNTTNGPRRIPAGAMPELLANFDMEGADEDNHVPDGMARHYWKPVAQCYQGWVCPCKQDELAIVEGDYVWRPLP